MDAINIITEIYKQELAQANHQKSTISGTM